jgi:hypothetical protein
MKRVVFLVLIAVGLAPATFAQRPETDHVQVGAYADYFRLSQTNTDFAGLGGRLTFTAYRQLKLEGEMSYDFNKVFTEGFSDNSTVPPTVTVARSSIRVLHGLFGPKLELGHHSFHPFVTVKGGFVDFLFDNRPANFNTFASTVDNLRSRDVSAVLYPGGGLEGHLGPVGLRLDAGDEIYFAGGTHHNLRIAFGPYIRF